MNKVKVIAYYLPQYHPLKENDEWWGKGFTEWTNVGKAKALYKGHYQPKVPADLGYYDLRLPIVREQQAQMAKDAGIYGFMYWHYWFGNGRQLMADIFDDVLDSGKPDFPFCLGWANHSWFAKNWNADGTRGKDRLLIEQKYLGVSDYRMHYEYCLKAFKDSRYVKQNGAPVFLIFQPEDLPSEFIPLWQQWAKADGLENGIYFIATANMAKVFDNKPNIKQYINRNFNAVVVPRLSSANRANKKGLSKFVNRLLTKIKPILHIPAGWVKYEKAIEYFVTEQEKEEISIPVIIPNFDHSPRSGYGAQILDHVTPELFKKHVHKVINVVKNKENKLIMLRSWNEWGEGNYMEPDLKNGHIYLDVLKEEIENANNVDE